ncbi:hypothetical protein CRG98_041852 [Punica granatum]|uniref:Uncharacterized protein n=1 Tax=Punica granatum TaxID=22663 RepID=A0A2I0I2T9_PUNGR|nr:hypothetical protein CRG98_041852 [Punica granatum]
MTKGDEHEMIKTANEKPPKPKARLPPKRGAIKVWIVKLLGEKLVSLCQIILSFPFSAYYSGHDPVISWSSVLGDKQSRAVL